VSVPTPKREPCPCVYYEWDGEEGSDACACGHSIGEHPNRKGCGGETEEKP